MFMQVSRGPLVLNLSSHHGDGTPGTAVLVVVDDVEALHAELRDKGYPFMSPGIEPHGVGREMELLDPASNQIRFSSEVWASPSSSSVRLVAADPMRVAKIPQVEPAR